MARVSNEPIDDFTGWHLAAYRPKNGPESEHHLEAIRGLSADEMERFETARTAIISFLQREPYSLVVTNYSDYTDYRESLDEMVVSMPQSEWPDAFSIGQELRRRFFNWLLAVRIFLKHTEIHFKRTYGEESGEFERVKGAMATAFDADFSYRFMDRLRNYAEHSGFPPLEGRIKGELVGETRVRLVHLWFDRDELLARFKRWGRLKAELEGQEQQFAAEEHMARMMAHLHAIHAVAQAIEGEDLRDHMVFIEGLIEEAARSDGLPQLVKLDEELGMSIRPFPLVTRELLGIGDEE